MPERNDRYGSTIRHVTAGYDSAADIEEIRLEQLNSEHACDHGAMIRRAGISSRTHKAYAGWFCPEDARDCAPEWADLGDIIGEALTQWATAGTS